MASDMMLTAPSNTLHSKDNGSDALAHSTRTRARDVVVGYTGAFSNEDTWGSRLALSAEQDGFSNRRRGSKQLWKTTSRALRPASATAPEAEDDVAGEDDVDDAGDAVSDIDDETGAFDVDDIVTAELPEDNGDDAVMDMLSAGPPVSRNAGNSLDTLLEALTVSRATFVDAFATTNMAYPAQARQHATIPDQRDAKFVCPIDGCSKEFNVSIGRDCFRPRSYLKHLDDHGIKNKTERDALMPEWARSPCFFPCCRSEECFPQTRGEG
ncbi:hypothetical protein C7974DRAFT_412064 [Boeremia exigua]|uniref:uncharacterized protein n=1 Tax=Boeremia exigua TaxID=749465 RepID=UPI001E8E20FC|nr:uncharacterized protein C7974DRAFT_412064 [Boeremia exigua]KAH6633034.1 hypothetical protein C7974DRAFT_412064 [Boeremia exigua]